MIKKVIERSPKGIKIKVTNISTADDFADEYGDEKTREHELKIPMIEIGDDWEDNMQEHIQQHLEDALKMPVVSFDIDSIDEDNEEEEVDSEWMTPEEMTYAMKISWDDADGNEIPDEQKWEYFEMHPDYETDLENGLVRWVGEV